MRKNFMFILAALMLISCLIGVILFFKHEHILTAVKAGICAMLTVFFYLSGIIEERDEQIATLRSKLFMANKQLDKYEKQFMSNKVEVNEVVTMYDINSFI